MTTWAICSVQYITGRILIKASQEINLAWLEKQYTETVYEGHEVSEGLF